jgi:hypothetical protein
MLLDDSQQPSARDAAKARRCLAQFATANGKRQRAAPPEFADLDREEEPDYYGGDGDGDSWNSDTYDDGTFGGLTGGRRCRRFCWPSCRGGGGGGGLRRMRLPHFQLKPPRTTFHFLTKNELLTPCPLISATIHLTFSFLDLNYIPHTFFTNTLYILFPTHFTQTPFIYFGAGLKEKSVHEIVCNFQMWKLHREFIYIPKVLKSALSLTCSQHESNTTHITHYTRSHRHNDKPVAQQRHD